ncbi:MAG: DUF4097 family beta strand repeat-containing protein [Janthinobacterium lividum]
MIRFLLAVGLLLTALGAARAQRLESQAAPYKAGQRVALRLREAQRIEVKSGDELRVTAHVSLNNNQQNEAYTLVQESTPDEVLFTEKLDLGVLRKTVYQGECHGIRNNSGDWSQGPASGGYSYCARLDYEVTVPAGAEVHLSTTCGDVYVHDLTGAVFITDVSGSLKLAGVRGPVVAKTVSGYVEVDSPGTAPLMASSTSGNVEVSWPPTQNAALNMQTTSGTATAEPAPQPGLPKPARYVGRQLQANYGSGSGEFVPVRLQAASGNVVFRQAK